MKRSERHVKIVPGRRGTKKKVEIGYTLPKETAVQIPYLPMILDVPNALHSVCKDCFCNTCSQNCDTCTQKRIKTVCRTPLAKITVSCPLHVRREVKY